MAKQQSDEEKAKAEKEAADAKAAKEAADAKAAKEAADAKAAKEAADAKAAKEVADATVPEGTVLMEAPKGSTGINVAGTEYKATDTGHVLIPQEHVETAKSHGFIVTELLKLEAAVAADLKKLFKKG